MTRAAPVLLCALGALLSCSSDAPAPRPSLLLIVVDTLRSDRLGVYGADRPTSPSIDALAADSVRFENAYATAPWTLPSVASMLTGLHPSEHGVIGIRRRLPSTLPFLPEILRNEGYATSAVVSHLLLGAGYGFARGFDSFDETEGRGHDHISSEAVTEKAVAELKRLVAADRPFLLWVHYFDPHYSYQRYERSGFAAREGAGRLGGGESIEELRPLTQDLSADELEFLRALYDEEIARTDAAVGTLIASLDASPAARSTIVVLTADHGEAFREHGHLGHTESLYEELVRVPLLVRSPRLDSRPVETAVSLVGLAPTLLDLLGLDHGLPGTSFAALLEGEGEGAARPIFSEVDRGSHQRSVRLGNDKLVYHIDARTSELYDLEDDPDETRNLAPRDQATTRRLLRALEAHRQRIRSFRTRSQTPSESLDLDERTQRELEALGYGDAQAVGRE